MPKFSMEPLQPTSVVRFGTYEVSLQSGEVRKSGMKIRIQQQPMKLLQILLEQPGIVVTREELQSRVWPDESFGDFDQALNIAIAKLRSALGDSAENPRFIETLPKRGYRFIADVSIVDPGTASGRPDSARTLPPQPPEDRAPEEPAIAAAPIHGFWPTRKIVFAILLLLILPALAIWVLRSRRPASTSIRSLAVLPLDNLSGDASQDYFAEGMTDELITDLAHIRALRVISRTSVMPYKHAQKSLPEIARELNVDAVVEGTVQRSGDQVRITAQLIEAPADKHLWAQSYESDLRDTLALQKKVANAIAEEIRIEVTPNEQALLKKANAVNPAALESYLKGRYFWSKRTPDDFKVAKAYFQQAIDEDPTYAQAYAGLADTYNLMGDWEYGTLAPREAYPKGKAAAIKALELDNTLGEAHTSLAFSMDVFDWDWQAAEIEFNRAIELNPGYATAHHWYAWHLAQLGRNTDAIAEMKKAEHLDPLSLIISADMSEIFLVAHQNDEAIEQSRKTVDMDRNFAIAHYELGQSLLQKNNYNEAITEFQKAVELSGGSTTCLSNLAYVYALSNRKPEALKILSDLQNRPARDASQIALIYVGLGNHDKALKWLEKAFEDHFNPSILVRPAFDPLRVDPRFQDLLRRTGLPS